MATADPIRNKKHVRQIAKYYLDKGQPRNYALVMLGVHTALRIGDLLRLTWDEVYNFEKKHFRPHVHIVEQKTGKPKTFALNKDAVQALKLYASLSGKCQENRFIFENNRKNHAAISRIQAYRIIRAAAKHLRLNDRISCHSMRKTFGYHAWKSGVPVTVIMDIYNHSSFDVTRRYLGVCQDDRDHVYRKMSFR